MLRRRVKRRETETAENQKTSDGEETESVEATTRTIRLKSATQTTSLESVEQTTILESASAQDITCVISLSEFIVAASLNGNILVYGKDTSGTARAVFTEHSRKIVCLAQLENDLVVSVDEDGQMFTWRPSTTETVGWWKNDEIHLSRAVAKLDDKRLIVGTMKGTMTVFSHRQGANLKMENLFLQEHNSDISRFFVSNNLLVSCSRGNFVSVFTTSRLNRVATLQVEAFVSDVAASDTHIVMVSFEGDIYVLRNAPPYQPDFILRASIAALGSVICLGHNIIATAGSSGCVYFICLSTKSIVAEVRVSYYPLTSLAVLSDNRIAVTNSKGLCRLFRPPPQVLEAVNDYTTNLCGADVSLPVPAHPVSDAWCCVQQGSLSLVDACETVIKSQNTATSLDEWCAAHNLLMQAVNTGVVPRSRDYNGISLHWHLELYQHCNKLAIGEKDIDFLISMFRQAEDVGVIAEGTSEGFVCDVGIRKDVDKDNWYSANAIYQLFLRQAETDTRLRQVLHYQKVQQLTSMINAVLGFIPIGGSMATNAISGGAAILNDFQVCGLVESLMGVSRELSGGFAADKLVDMFVRRGNEVLSEDHWGKWGEENRKAVQDAARNLGLTVGELRVKLLRVAQMMNDGQVGNIEENDTAIVEAVEDEQKDKFAKHETSKTEIETTPSHVVSNPEVIRLKEVPLDEGRIVSLEESRATPVCLVEGERRNNPADVRASAAKMENAIVPPDSNAEESEQNGNFEEARVQLARWANESLNKLSIEKLKSGQLANCVAAFLVNYDEHHVSSYVRLKDMLKDVFLTQFIDGSSFAFADRGHREELLQACMTAITTVAEGLGTRNLGIRLNLFLQLLRES